MVEMKESGIEWIGNIPKDWNVYKVKDAFTLPCRKNSELNFKVNQKTFEKLKKFQIVEDYSVELTADTIIYSPCEYGVNDVKNFIEICLSKGKKPYLDTPNFALEKDIETIKNIISQTGVGIVANNYYALTLTNNLIIGANYRVV